MKRWIWVLPATLVLLGIVVAPLIYALRISFFKWPTIPGVKPTFNGVVNYIRIFTSDDRFWGALEVTFKYLAIAIPLQLILGFVLASALFRLRKGKQILSTYFLIPAMIPPVTVGAIWLLMLSTYYGPVNYFLNNILGLGLVDWLTRPGPALAAIVVTDTWEWTPFMMIILYSGLVALPRTPYESAAIDGASAWQSFRYITLPLLAPPILVALIIRTIDGFKLFDIIYMLTAGGPGNATEVVSYYLYRTGFKYWNMSYAAALSVIVLIIMIAFISIYAKVLQRRGVI